MYILRARTRVCKCIIYNNNTYEKYMKFPHQIVVLVPTTIRVLTLWNID